MAKTPMKENITARMVNELRDTAIEFHDHQSLRERIINVVQKYISRGAPLEDKLRARIEELETVCADAYQIVGAMSGGFKVREDMVIKTLDNLSDAALTHKDTKAISVGEK